jgi:hypothetical protein
MNVENDRFILGPGILHHVVKDAGVRLEEKRKKNERRGDPTKLAG